MLGKTELEKEIGDGRGGDGGDDGFYGDDGDDF